MLYPTKAALEPLETYGPVYEACLQAPPSHLQARLNAEGLRIKMLALIAHDRVLCGTVKRGRE